MISPPDATAGAAAAKLRQGDWRRHELDSLPEVDTNVRCAGSPLLWLRHEVTHDRDSCDQQHQRCEADRPPGHKGLRQKSQSDAVSSIRNEDAQERVIGAMHGNAPAVEVGAPAIPRGLADHDESVTAFDDIDVEFVV